jgi:membrane fusion protein
MSSQADSAIPGEAPPFLSSDPPHWAARGLALTLILLFALAAVASVSVHVPETITTRFVLVPVHGSDPVRAFKDGIVTAVHASDAQPIRAGETLVVLASPPVGDRAVEWQNLKSDLAGAEAKLATARERYQSEERARGEEESRLKIKLDSLQKTIRMNTEELSIANELAQRQKKAFEEGISSWTDLARLRIEINRLQVEDQQAKSDRDDTLRALAKVKYERQAKQLEFQQTERGLTEDFEKSKIRSDMLGTELAQTGSELTAVAPCTGSVLKMYVRSAGASVREGDLLADVSCQGQKLQAELTVPQDGLALLRTGQPVKLLYDAFPYQRYGVHYGKIRWVSPASMGEKDGTFRALADLAEDSVPVAGSRRPVQPGMGGRARVIVGRRSLVSYAFEPLRQLKESLGGAPPK